MRRLLALLDRLVDGNPLLAHGPRPHATGIALPATDAPETGPRPA